MEKARDIIREVLNTAKRPVVMWGAGKDSQLLLHLVREFKPDIAVLWYRSDLLPKQREFAEKVIRDWNLTVCGYGPRDRYYVPTKDGLTLVNEYSIGHDSIPVLVDVAHSDRCGLRLSETRTPQYGYLWDATLVGWKATDSHPLLGLNPFPPDGGQIGPTRVYGPLRHMTDEGVWAAIHKLNVPVDEERYSGDGERDPDTLLACTRCLRGEAFCPELQAAIPAYEWNGGENLRVFRARFGAVQGGEQSGLSPQ